MQEFFINWPIPHFVILNWRGKREKAVEQERGACKSEAGLCKRAVNELSSLRLFFWPRLCLSFLPPSFSLARLFAFSAFSVFSVPFDLSHTPHNASVR